MSIKFSVGDSVYYTSRETDKPIYCSTCGAFRGHEETNNLKAHKTTIKEISIYRDPLDEIRVGYYTTAFPCARMFDTELYSTKDEAIASIKN